MRTFRSRYGSLPATRDSGLQRIHSVCIQQRAKKIVIVPFFLQLGTHVTADIPQLVDELRHRHPEIEIALTEPVGSHPLLVDAALTWQE